MYRRIDIITCMSPVNSPHKASDAEFWCLLICALINGWVNTREAGDLRRHRVHYDVTVMTITIHVTHYNDVIMGTIASQITSLTIVYSIVYSDADQTKHQSSASLAFVRGIHRGPVNSPHKWSVTRKMFPFDDVIMGQISGSDHRNTKECREKPIRRELGYVIRNTSVPTKEYWSAEATNHLWFQSKLYN